MNSLIEKLLAIPINILLYPINIYLKHKNLFIISREGSAIGDHLTITSVVDFLHKEYKAKTIVLTNFKDFFIHNPNVKKTILKNSFPKLINTLLNIFFYFSKQSRIIHYRFHKINNQEYEEYMFNTQAKIHLRETNLLHTIHYKKIKNKLLKNRIYFTKKELQSYKKKFKHLPKNYALIQSKAKTDYAPAKDWGKQNMQQVISKSQDINWIQMGIKTDPLLKHTKLDLRSKTTLREICYLIKNASFTLCNEGLYTHIAGAFDTPCITVFTDFCPKQLSAYKNVIALAKPPLKKYIWTTIQDKNKLPKPQIAPDDVIKAIQKISA